MSAAVRARGVIMEACVRVRTSEKGEQRIANYIDSSSSRCRLFLNAWHGDEACVTTIATLAILVATLGLRLLSRTWPKV